MWYQTSPDGGSFCLNTHGGAEISPYPYFQTILRVLSSAVLHSQSGRDGDYQWAVYLMPSPEFPANALKGTVSNWNESVKTGIDPDFGRPEGTMFAPIESPPFYAMEAWPVIVNTQGGPAYNARQQIVDVSGESIPRLYAAGELGAMWGHSYELGGNLGECISSGRIDSATVSVSMV